MAERLARPITPSLTDINLSSFIWSVADLLRGDYKQFRVRARRHRTGETDEAAGVERERSATEN
ncbi:MAG: hypothetical protein AB7I50_01380 [Vicinamibacterales bacterium]